VVVAVLLVVVGPVADRSFAITVALHNVICPHGKTYPIKTVAMVKNRITIVQPDRPRPTAQLPPHSNDKPEAATAVDKFLMMGMRLPETC
jgi:hypothetical protein